MISANEARRITDAANFEKSGLAGLINSTVRGVASGGQDSAVLLIPQNIVNCTVEFLEKHGFRVIVDTHNTGAMVTVAW